MSIESLLIKQAQLSDLRKELKAKGCDEAGKCPNLGHEPGGICIDHAYRAYRDELHEDPMHYYEEISFEEVWSNMVNDGLICKHCQNVRALKKQRMQAGRELGGVRAAITRVGRRLAQEQAA